MLALVYLAREKSDGFIPIETIASEQGIPSKFLEQIMLSLKRTNLLQSMKGQHGGYRLAKPPDQITLAEIVRLMDGPIAATGSVSQYFYQSTPIEKEQNLTDVFRRIRDYVSHELEHTTLADAS